MNTAPSNDRLVALWQTAPPPDPHRLIRDLQRLQRMHRRLIRVVAGLLAGVSLLLMLAEATGRPATHGILSAIWILGLTIGTAWRWRARCSRIDAVTLDTVNSLKWMLGRAKRDLLLARCLYAGVPCGALTGAVVSNLLRHGSSPEAALRPASHPILSVAGLSVLLLMMAAGFVLAWSRRSEVKRLAERLRSAEVGL